MLVHGPHATENTNLALHVLDLVMKALANESFIVVFAAQDVLLQLQLLHLPSHQLLSQLALFLNRSKLFSQVLALLLQPTFSLLILTQLFRDPFLLPLYFFEFLFTASDDVLALIEALLGLLLELFLEAVVLLEYFLLDLRLGQLRHVVLGALRVEQTTAWGIVHDQAGHVAAR